jgi:hypothetical protein
MNTIEELLGSGSCLENLEYVRGDPLRLPCDTLYMHKLALTSPTSGCHSVVIVCSRTKATEFKFYVMVEVCLGTEPSHALTSQDCRMGSTFIPLYQT